MADKQDPYKNFPFRVEVRGVQIAAFANMTLPGESVDSIEYREGTDPFVRKVSDLANVGSITLMRGITRSNDLYEWWRLNSQGSGGPGDRKNVSIVVVNATGNETGRLTLSNAWPTKYQPGALDAEGNTNVDVLEMAAQSIERAK